MAFQLFKKKNSFQQKNNLIRQYTDQGIILSVNKKNLQTVENKYLAILDAFDLDAFVDQLLEEGYAVENDHGEYIIHWEQLYSLLMNEEYKSSLEILKTPQQSSISPILKSTNSLSDPNFTIAISGWHDGRGQNIVGIEIVGAIASKGHELFLIQQKTWETLQKIKEFHKRSIEKRTDAHQRVMWGTIRQTAKLANAILDDFLCRSVVLTPEKLQIELKKNEVLGVKVVEIIPLFDEAPEKWIDVFDRTSKVPDRYEVTTREGIVQILITPQVKTVLDQIKKMDRRRVTGIRAESFLVNPFAALGDDASEVIVQEQFEKARENAGIYFERFTSCILPDDLGYPEKIGILIESVSKSGLSQSDIEYFKNDLELDKFIRSAKKNIDSGLQLFAWNGHDFELLGDTHFELAKLKDALEERRKPKIIIDHDSIYDLNRYSSRIESIDIEEKYYSPYIAKISDDGGWFPENITPVISFQTSSDSEAVAIQVTSEIRKNIEKKIFRAEKEGKDEFELAPFPQPLKINRAKEILQSFDEAANDHYQRAIPHKESISCNKRKSLIIRPNINNIDYEETRRLLNEYSDQPYIPDSLLGNVSLLAHQQQGLAKLRHLFDNSPAKCRGVILADDMGLGKTLQILCLIASIYEKNAETEPALVVAPVSLLENWIEEIKKFFKKGSLPFLTIYGENIKSLKVPKESIDQQLKADNLINFFKPDWRGNARLILTTYETLKNFEFSFAAQKWSIMICDEAQKIKNPNAMITRSAKKQNVRFRLACTGTPVENSLTDLWCLFDFIQPGYLGALNSFSDQYLKPIEARTDKQKECLEELRKRIDPQVIRRMKKDVIDDLPQKIEKHELIDLSEIQRNLYSTAIESYRKRKASDSIGPFNNHLGLLHYLRLICSDPKPQGLSNFSPVSYEKYSKEAPKIKWLIDKLSEIKTKQEKVIIFCEFREIQRLLRHYIESIFSFSPDIINGDTSASASALNSRQKRIKAFQEKDGFSVIILSPVAVGFGVNIQEANHVIHYTRTWNPAKEDQATDRAYRIGQKKDVYVYYPIVKADDFTTFDVRLNTLLQKKRELADDMLNGTGSIKPGDFDISDFVSQYDKHNIPAKAITADDINMMTPEFFESFIAALWQKKGFNEVVLTPRTGDDGVDVVALNRPYAGELIQCKTSSIEDIAIGWDGIKDVVAGAASYSERYKGIIFNKVCITNRFFNATAQRHAEKNMVDLYDQNRIDELLQEYPLTMDEVERFHYKDWNQL